MKAGRVIRMRVNPRDCISVADVIELLGLKPELLTFDSACRIVLSALLESARQSGRIPDREGFEFTQFMQRFELHSNDRTKKYNVGELLGKIELVKPLPGISQERARRERRFTELRIQFESDPVNHPRPTPGTPEYAEWEALVMEFTQ